MQPIQHHQRAVRQAAVRQVNKTKAAKAAAKGKILRQPFFSIKQAEAVFPQEHILLKVQFEKSQQQENLALSRDHPA